MSAKEAKSHHTTDPPPPVVVVLDSHEDADDYGCDDDDDPSPPKKKRAKNSTKTTTIDANNDGSDEGKDAHTKAGRRRTRRTRGDKSFRPESDTLLDDMLHPLTVDDFLDDHFRHNAVHIDRRNLPRKMREGLVSIIRERYLFDLNVRKIFEETSSENVFLWLRPPSPSTPSSSSMSSPPPPPLDSVEISDPEIAHKLHVSGSHPAYCRAPPSLERLLVSSLLRSTGLGGGHYHPPHNDYGVAATLGGGTTLGRGEVELFVGTTTSSSNTAPTIPTPATSSSRSRGGGNKKTNGDGGGGKSGSSSRVAGGCTTTGWHTDFQENFTIQLTGIKRWTLRRGRVRHPLRGTTPHFARVDGVVENQLKAARMCRPSEGGGDDDSTPTSTSPHFEGGYGFEYSENNAHGPEFTITMRPGDVLYFPAGMWHRVETLEYGVSMNVSLMGTTYATLVCEALQHLLVGGADGDGWREVVMTSRPPATTTGGGGRTDGGGTNATTMTGRLGGLLAGLGRLVDDFVMNGGGARSLLPPALCHPPFPPPGHEDDDDDGGDGGPSEEEGRDGSGGSSSDGGESEVGDNDDDDDGDDSGEEGPSSSSYGIVVSMDDFVGPSCWDSSRPPNSKRFVRNPLATLMAMPDIAGHDDHPRRRQQQEQQRHRILNGDRNNGDEERHHRRAPTRQYVLNVNFAGNEMMESHVRVILETSDSSTVDRMEDYLACEQRGTDPGLLPSDPEYAGGSSANDHVPQMCLFYYGYFVWI